MTSRFAVLTLVSSLFSLPACARQAPAAGDAAGGQTRIFTIGELTWQDVAALDRAKTLFLLTIGMLEEHGPHLPIAADTFGVEYEARGVAERVSQSLPDWNVVVMPTLHYGSSGANQIGRVAIHPGTYGIRQSTLRAVVADIGGQIAQNGFKWIFVMNGHGAPTHHIAVNDGCDFVSETFEATMVNVSGLFSADASIQAKGMAIAAKHFSAADLSSFGRDVHGGVGETSGMLAVRPDLVRTSYKTLPSYSVGSLSESREVASKPGWPGYFSAPASARADYGRDVEAWWVEGMSDLILQGVRGDSLMGRPRWPFPVTNDPAYPEVETAILQPEREFEVRLETWLRQREGTGANRRAR
jgi:creatinine amidohydrolase